MSDKRISQLPGLTSSQVVLSTDVLPIVRASDNTTYKITAEEFKSAITVYGSSGTSGSSGSSGTSGTSGLNGSSGTSGVNGSSGTSGVNGSSGTSPLSGVASYGEMYIVGNSTATNLTTAGTYYKISATSNWVAGENRNFTADTANARLICNQAGYYHLTLPMSYRSSNTTTFTFAIYLNGSIQNEYVISTEGPSGQDHSATIAGIVAMNSGDYLELFVKASTNSEQIVMKTANISTSAITGDSGTSGSSGSNGTSGSSGSSGTSGTDGFSGLNGSSGTSGTDGTSGSSGVDGLSTIDIGTTAIISGVNNRVLFESSNKVSESANFIFDTDKLGINTTPGYALHIKSAPGFISKFETTTSTLDIEFATTVGSGTLGVNSDALYVQALDSLSNGIYFWPNTSGSNSLHLLANGRIRHNYSPSTYLETEITSGGNANFVITGSQFYFNNTILTDTGIKIDTGNIEFYPGGAGGGSSLTIYTYANDRTIEFSTKVSGSQAVRMGLYGGSLGIGTTTPIEMLDVAGSIVVTGATATVRLKGYTVGTLPSTAIVGDMAYVTDASGPTYLGVATGGGSDIVKVFFNGTNWIT